MSQRRTKNNIIFSIIFATLAVAVSLAGCSDEIIYNNVEIPDTEVEVSGTVSFKSLSPIEVKTRSEAPEGEKYRGIKSLYVFFFNEDKELVEEYTGEVTNFTPTPSEGSTHEHVTFKKRIQAGKYHVFAVVNISTAQKEALKTITSIEDLRNFKLNWDDNISQDLEMFGIFKSEKEATPENEYFYEDGMPLAITPATASIHSWVRRATSKVTIDFDGTNLKENVTVYIKKAVLKDVASGALLGAASKVGENDFICTQSQYVLTYGEGEGTDGGVVVTKGGNSWTDGDVNTFHDDDAKALPCYENMQGIHGEKSKWQDKNEDGIIDSQDKDGVENGTYLEVEGYYVSNRTEYKSEGKIIYRFMLGQNAENDFNLIRNHHYKITMNFKGYGNDIDWHIVYAEKYLDISYPEDVNYQGKFFTPDPNFRDIKNAGHTFSEQNVITVTSYKSPGDGEQNTWIEPVVEYKYYSYNEATRQFDIEDPIGGWLQVNEGEVSEDQTQKQFTYVASMSTPTTGSANSLFLTTSKGTVSSPYNLSNSSGGMTVENTANCYMVGAPGWYCFPLVYGNGFENGSANSSAFASNYRNHLNKEFKQPYIKDNEGISVSSGDVSVRLIWQDVKDMVIPDDIIYDETLFGNKGGIKFHISDIKEGNAVIALIDNRSSIQEDEFVNINRGEVYGTSGSTKAIWSWHIWATPFGFNDKMEKNIKLLNRADHEFEVLPINLGWCSDGREIRYYPRRKCVITFTVGNQSIIREIEQYPHFVLPRGDHPYYQWGRKDPFIGSNLAWGNKPRWTATEEYGTENKYNPPRLYNEPGYFYQDDKRKNTQDCLDVLVKNPDKWHNATRWPNDVNDYEHKTGFYSTNVSFSDLWSNNGAKTVYDPCPAGYQVGSDEVFSGFTWPDAGAPNPNTFNPYGWNDVLESNMIQDYYSADDMKLINTQVIEFYTDTRKLQSITFPVTGYRDYDDNASVECYYDPTLDPETYVNYNSIGFVWSNKIHSSDLAKAYHLKFQRGDIITDWTNRKSGWDSGVRPKAEFYNCDGFAVRPVKTK